MNALERDESSTRGLASLELGAVVFHGLALLRLASRAESAFLIDAGASRHLRPFLTPLDNPTLPADGAQLGSAITASGARAFRLSDSAPNPGSASTIARERRVWVRPLRVKDGPTLALACLVLPGSTAESSQDMDEQLEVTSEHVAVALQNAITVAEIRELNERLEREVVARLTELEESRAASVSQDRLATLGRLVAAIAHELNNPIGALASFSRTLRDLVEPILLLRSDITKLFPAASDAALAGTMLDAALAASRRVAPDTRQRRALEDELEAMLATAAVPAADSVARRAARLGFARVDLEPALSVLRTHGDVLLRHAERLHTFGRSIETIGDCAANVARIVDGLKTYAHLDQSQMEIADLHRSLSATLTVLAPRIPSGIEVRTSFAEIAPLPHRPGEMSQVWTNLVDNAQRAMGEQGVLEIETTEQNGVVRVRFTDTGEGIPPMLQDRIFELHVTSRGSGAGLGLGLPICRSIVEDHHDGSLVFESRPGRTVFSVYLPRRVPGAEARDQ